MPRQALVRIGDRTEAHKELATYEWLWKPSFRLTAC